MMDSLRSPSVSLSSVSPSPRGSGLFSTAFRDHFLVTRFIRESGQRLKMKAVPIATASVIYLRFFRECSPSDYDPYLVAATALYLAAKVEENHVKIRDVVNVTYRHLHPNRLPLDIEQYWQVRESVCNCELHMLRALRFSISFTHPHKYLLQYLWSLGHWMEPMQWEQSPIRSVCWAVLNDLYHDDFVLKYKPSHIAVAVIYFVMECYGLQVPFNGSARTEWWNVFCEDLREEQLWDMIREMLHIYDKELLLLA